MSSFLDGAAAAARPGRALAAAAVLALGLAACGGGSGEEQPAALEAQAVPVSVATVSLGPVAVDEVYAGRVRAAREVEVRARVDGILEERLYDEGGAVAQGAPLFRIDPKPFEVAVLLAEAERETAEAELRQAEREWERLSPLFDRDVVSERDRDNALAGLELARAGIARAAARLEQARLELGYTEVTAPIAGLTSLEAEPEGSLVSRGTLLTTIVQQDPVHVRFALPEDDAAVQRAALQGMRQAPGAAATRHEARLVLPDGSEHPQPGEIDFTASTVDPRTGTVSARAVFANPDGAIVPGQFVRVRVVLQTIEQAAVIPDAAVGQGPGGPQVFVVDEEGLARARTIELGPLVEGGRVVLAGLEGGERLVVNGQVALRDGTLVAAEPAEGALAEALTTAAGGSGEDG
jgi:membrane fusion protein, multidrug efflux system